MEWRCEWCGKPHDEDDPPCDNCGHGSFERAVVRRPASDTGDGADPDTTTVWVCPACGREHPKNTPPCSRCTNGTLERRDKRVDESNLTERPGTAGDTGGGVETDTTTVWVCPACGREHTKHSPPCSRCNNSTLERTEKRVGETEVTASGYHELVTPRYLAALVGVLALAGLFALGLTGVVDVPGFSDSSVPAVDAPGNATAAGGLSLEAVERSYLGVVNDRRGTSGVDTLERSDHVDEVARFYNQRTVAAAVDDGTVPGESEIAELLGDQCGRASLLSFSLSLDGRDQADAVGDALAESAVSDDSVTLSGEYDRTGVDVHAIDGTLFVTQLVCG